MQFPHLLRSMRAFESNRLMQLSEIAHIPLMNLMTRQLGFQLSKIL